MERLMWFLKDNVLGKTLYTDELVYKLESDKLEGVYSDQITFANLETLEGAISFDMFVVSKEIVYELDGQKRNTRRRSNFSGVSLFRYELVKRKSTGKITGLVRFMSGSGENEPAQAVVSGVYDIEIQDEGLSWKEKQVLYRDQPGSQGDWRSIAFDSANKFYFESGKLHYEYSTVCYDVNPGTFERTLSHDMFPCFNSREK